MGLWVFLTHPVGKSTLGTLLTKVNKITRITGIFNLFINHCLPGSHMNYTNTRYNIYTRYNITTEAQLMYTVQNVYREGCRA